ncbi:MAG: hypothetical protein ACI8X5_004314 [Planctomycetota bacterium]|jgi:uncharacterized protein YaeQ
MGISATMYRFHVDLSDIDRGVYESLDLRVAKHASEDAERMIMRVLARAIAHEEGLEFGRGLSNVEDAGLWSHNLTGQIGTWIDVGIPGAERLHRASKCSEQLLVFTHKSETALCKEWRTRKIHRAEEIQIYRLPPKLIIALAEKLERKMNLFVMIQDRVLTVTIGDRSLEGMIEKISLSRLLGGVV